MESPLPNATQQQEKLNDLLSRTGNPARLRQGRASSKIFAIL